eukprot:CAMPEP_0196136684 /NCGR_PEP_ID=MMETSP0910-20130528/4909_1 /TAXON_ID=49265 /ORGANISM="Thalassiosira rotula, Strain GSO102" /LENGTH=712 /DNA_ID=CAMNT_0041397011 /DNA_START=3 /DNA_END=2141 /DNA_ORIENTATION=-
MASTRTNTEDGGDDGESITTETKSVEDAEKRGKGKRSRKGRRPKHQTASMDMDSCDDNIRILSGEGKIESANDTCEIHYDDSSICFKSLFDDLQHFKEDNNSLTISISHPTFISIMDNFSAVGMEELLKKRWENQFNSLKDFTKKHGDCNVPLEHPTLGEWVRIQRGHYELYKKRLPTPLTKKRFIKLEEILGFDEYNKPKEEDADKNLTLDKRISLKTATNKVRLMGRTNRAFYVPAKKKLPDKETVAAEIQKKREAGNFHKTAERRSLLLEEVFASIEEDEKLNSSSADNNDAGGENEKKKRQEEKEQCKIFSSSMPAMSTSDVSAKEYQEGPDSSTSVNVYEEKLEKLRRKLLAETNRTCYAPTTEEYDVVVEEESGSGSREEDTEEGILGPSMPVLSMSVSTKEDNERSDSTVDTYEGKMEKLIRRKLLVEENGSMCKPTSESSANDDIKDSKGIVALDVRAHNKNPYRRRATDSYLSTSMSRKAPSDSSTFEGRLMRKLQGDSKEDIYKDHNEKYLSASMPPHMEDDSSTVEDRTYHKLGGGNTDVTDRNQPGGNKRGLQKQLSFSLDEMIGGSSLAAEDNDVDTFYDTPGSGWRSKLNASRWISKDNIGVESWSNLDMDTTLQGVRFSRWKLLFVETEYGDKTAQSDCVSLVLNRIIYSDKWFCIPKENGDVALEMTTQSLDEHQKVELHVKELGTLFTRSDFYYY